MSKCVNGCDFKDRYGAENVTFKKFDFEIKSFDDNSKIIKGIASTNSEDRGGDIVTEEAMLKNLQRYREEGIDTVPMKLQHDRKMQIGGFPVEKMKIEKGKWNIEGEVITESDFAKQAYGLIKKGYLSSFSIGFYMLERTYKDDVRIIEDMFVFEISVVDIPMNGEATINEKAIVPYKNLPLAEQTVKWNSTEAINRVKAFTNSTEKPSSSYKNAFLWYDKENSENFGSYKLPIADVVDNELRAIPRAIFAAAGAMRGARGGVDIPENERQGIINNLIKYYDKMGLENPFNKKEINMTKEIVNELKDLSEVENLLRDAGFSKDGATALVAKAKSFNQKEEVSEEMKSIIEEMKIITSEFK